jgi:hypothetical protein
LGQDFWESKGAKTDLETRTKEMHVVKVKFNEGLEKSMQNLQVHIKLALQPETIEIPTVYEGNLIGTIAKEELIPEVGMSEALIT